MAFVKKTWQARISEYPNRRTITDENGVTKPVTVGRAEGTVTQEGDGFTAANMNDLEQRIYNAIQSGGGGGCSWTDITGTLTAGQTSVTLSDVSITTSSTIDVYTETDLDYNSITVAEGSVTITFDAQSSDVGVKVRVS